MKRVTLKDIETMAKTAFPALWQEAKQMGRDVKIYLHWTAGRYGQMYDDYHLNIDQDGSIWASTDDFSETLAHTWHRNTASIGITLCCGYGATTEDLGEYPPTVAQIDSMAQVIAVLAPALWLTIDSKRVMTHAEAADNIDGMLPEGDEYGPNNGCERWDLQFLGTDDSPEWITDYNDPRTGGNVIRGKANWYKNKFEAMKSNDEG
ncbi:peptidoglycan recognition protein family protein [Acidaminococcus sp. LBK-2]|uniref:peptidoglycan recognition protein family protein n=1 Tax=Acidaminococcus sp. LBK-2 TaxID=3456956 RepID=UPI003FA4A190